MPGNLCITNLSLNPSSNVQPVQIALSDAAGQAVLYRQADFADGGASLIRRADYHADTEEVTTTTLDLFLAQSGSPPPTFIKIDVEGLEGNVLTWRPPYLARRAAPFAPRRNE